MSTELDWHLERKATADLLGTLLWLELQRLDHDSPRRQQVMLDREKMALASHLCDEAIILQRPQMRAAIQAQFDGLSSETSTCQLFFSSSSSTQSSSPGSL